MFNISQIDHKLILNLSFTSYNLSSLMSYESCAVCILHCSHTYTTDKIHLKQFVVITGVVYKVKHSNEYIYIYHGSNSIGLILDVLCFFLLVHIDQSDEGIHFKKRKVCQHIRTIILCTIHGINELHMKLKTNKAKQKKRTGKHIQPQSAIQ